MKDKKEIIILMIATIPLLIYSLFVLESKSGSVSKKDILEDARQVHHLNDGYLETSDLSDHIAGVLYYKNDLSDHTFAVYLDENKNHRFRSFHSGSSSFIDRGVQAYYYEGFGLVIFSMNEKHVSQVRYSDKTLEVDPEQPFVLTFDENITSICLYDFNGKPVKIDQIAKSVASMYMTDEKIKAIHKHDEGSNLLIEYAGIHYNSLDGPRSIDKDLYDSFLNTKKPKELVEKQLTLMSVKAGFTLKLDFDIEPITYEVFSWYEPEGYDKLQVTDHAFSVSSHRPSEIILVKASYDKEDKYYAFKVDITDYYEIVPGLVYHVLEEEYLDNTYDDHSRFTRVYWCYDGLNDVSYPQGVAVAIDKVETISQARKHLKENHLNDIMFLENTVVSSGVKNQWLLEAYEPDLEYHSKSQKGLTYEEIKELN